MMHEDELATLKRLAGITNSFKGQTEYTIPTIENMSYTAAAVKKKEKENNIRPGDPEWFKLWFSRPMMAGGLNMPKGFRGRKKK